ncbi:hypothetical protein SEUCBS139899_002228 [Sporothrix eucalyptigena]
MDDDAIDSDIFDDELIEEDDDNINDNNNHFEPFREMDEPMSGAWNLVVSDADWAKLRQGFTPRDMDDRWVYRVTPIDRSGVITIHIARSWTDIQHYALHVLPAKDGEPETTKIIAITWEQNTNGIHITQEQAQKEVVIITRSILECDFDNYPDDLEWFSENHRIDRNINKKNNWELDESGELKEP